MGLDQYAVVCDINPLTEDIAPERATQFAYWRKHNRLEGWMRSLAEEKVLSDEMDEFENFNMIPLELTREDIYDLWDTIIDRGLPCTEGCFFGHDSYDLEYRSDSGYLWLDLDFCRKAMMELDAGGRVWYYSWW